MEAGIILQELLSKEKKIKQEIATLNEALGALQIVLRLYNDKSNAVANQPVIELSFTSMSSNNEKPTYEGRAPENHTERVYAVLSLRPGKKGKAKEVGQDLLQYYPDVFSEKRAFEVATLELSNLKKDGKIKGEKIIGKNSFIYSIDEAHDIL